MKSTVTVYTMSWNGYWDKYSDLWCEDINSLNTIPDEIIIVSDAPIDTTKLKHNNVKNIVSPRTLNKRMTGIYRNIAVRSSTSDWIVAADIDDRYAPSFIDNIPEDSDMHGFTFYNVLWDTQSYQNDRSLENRLYGNEDKNTIMPGVTAIKRGLFEKIRYEDGCHEDLVFFATASKIKLKLTYDAVGTPPRFYYSGFHNNFEELDRVSNLYREVLSGNTRPVYAFWFSSTMNDTRKAGLKILSKSAKNLVLLNTPRFYEFENKEIPIHKAFKYLTDNHKSDYARAYMMYFYGGGYSDIKPNSFDWDQYFDILYLSKYDAIGYAEKSADDIAVFYNDSKTKNYVYTNFNRFIGNGHYIFKPKTEIAHEWLLEIHKKLDERYNDVVKNPGIMVHITDPNYQKLIGDYPFEWDELGGRILHRLQYENGLTNFATGMPYTNNVNYK